MSDNNAKELEDSVNEVKKRLNEYVEKYADQEAGPPTNIVVNGAEVTVYVKNAKADVNIKEDAEAKEAQIDTVTGSKILVIVPTGANTTVIKGGFWPFNTYKKVDMTVGDIESIKAQLQILRADIENAFKYGLFDKKLYKNLLSRVDYSAKHLQKPDQLNQIAAIIEDFLKSLAARKTVIKDDGTYQRLLGMLDGLNIRIETAYKYKVIDPKAGAAYQARIAALRKDIKAKKPRVEEDYKALERDVQAAIDVKKSVREFSERVNSIKTIANDGATGLQATLIALYNAFVGVANDFTNTGKISRILLIIGFVVIILGAYASYKMLDIFVMDYAASKLRNNPLNGESADFKVAQASTGFSKSNKYPYKIFLITPLIILGCALGVFLAGFLFGETTTGAMTGIYALLIGYGLIILVMNYMLFYAGNHMLALVKTRITEFNIIALSHLYPNTNVLDLYTKVQPNTFQVMDTIREGTRSLQPDISSESLAKFLYTTNLYLHYQKIGIRNTAILDALDIFNPRAALLRGVFAPADYLFRKSTYIEDYTDNILAIYKRAAQGASASAALIPDKIQNEASIMVADWMADANNRANTFYAEDAINPFLIMAILIFLVNTFPFLILLYIFRKEEVRDALFAVINKISASKNPVPI